jgi:hypothetical protein
MEIVKKAIEEITPDPGNVRKHSQKNIDAIKASLNRFGQQKPIVCDNKMCVRAGNGTLQAAKELGWTHINVVVSDLDRADLIAYGIADNRTAELAEWDIDGLEEQLAGLDEELANIAYADFDFGGDFEFKDPDEASGTKLDDNKLTVTCDSLDAKDELFKELNERGYKVK